MSDILSFVELAEQHVELLPTRTALSLFINADPTSPCDANHNCSYPPGHQTNTGDGNYDNVTYGANSNQTNSAGTDTVGSNG